MLRLPCWLRRLDWGISDQEERAQDRGWIRFILAGNVEGAAVTHNGNASKVSKRELSQTTIRSRSFGASRLSR